MTEELKVEDKGEEKQEAYIPKDKWEEKAIASGWKPEEQWEGDKEEWRPAREYIERGELFEKIEGQKHELKQMRKVLETLKDHHLKVKQEAMEDAIALLKKQRNEAKKEEDLGKVLELTEEIDLVQEKQKAALAKAKAELQDTTVAEPTPGFKEWHKSNQWYKVDGTDAMSTYANAEGDRYIRVNPTATERDVFEHVEKEVRKEFPDRFKTSRPDPKVESNSSTRPTKGADAKYQLSAEEEKIGKTLVNSGVLTWEAYIKDLKKYDETRGSK